MKLVWKERTFFSPLMLQFPYPSPSPRQDQRTVLAKDALFFNSVTNRVYIDNQKYKKKAVLK